MSLEGCSIDENGNISDEAFHAEFLNDPQVNALADSLAIEHAIATGLTPEQAHELIEAQPSTPSTAPILKIALGKSAIRERQIDFILQEEFSLGTRFLQAFLDATEDVAAEYDGQVRPAARVAAVCDARASVRDQYYEEWSGETDVLVLYRLENDPEDKPGRALLIENKINAAFRPNQAKHYRSRGEHGKGYLWSDFITCLVAPASYIKPGHGFQSSISLETIKPLLAPDSLQRRKFRQEVIDAAIKSHELIGPKVKDEAVTEFRREYYEAFEEFRSKPGLLQTLAGIQSERPRAAYFGDTWFTFTGAALGKVMITHKAPTGSVDLSFPHTDVQTLRKRFSVESDMTHVQTGKSASIRLKVAEIPLCIDFPAKRVQAEEAFRAVSRLVDFFKRLEAESLPSNQ